MADTTILVVDDEPQIRRVLRTTLSGNGYDVILAKDGQEAIEMVIRERPGSSVMASAPDLSDCQKCLWHGKWGFLNTENAKRDPRSSVYFRGEGQLFTLLVPPSSELCIEGPT